jgi:hypothetical protein
VLRDGDAGERGKMRRVGRRFNHLAIIIGLIASLNIGHGKTISGVDPSVSNGDIETMLTVLETVAPLPPELLPRSGTFWSAKFPNLPPFPCNPNSLNAWPLGDGVFVLDDRRFDYAMASSPQARTLTAMEAVSLDFSDGGGNTNTAVFTEGASFDYGTNLWIANFALSQEGVAGVVSNTTANVSYEIQYKNNLTNTEWLSTGLFILGSEATNWTALVLTKVSRTNDAYFRIRSWQDDGSGLPNWWQREYFGATGVDPYGDPDGDGWDNLQEFQNGTNPMLFNTPQAPRCLTVSYDPNTSVAMLNWLASRGPVTGYTLERDDYANFNLSAGITSYQDTVPPGAVKYAPVAWGPTIFGSYRMRAHYPGGDSAWTDWVDMEPGDTSTFLPQVYGMPVYLVSGPQGSAYLAETALPTDTIAIRLTRIDYWAHQVGDSSFDACLTIPLSAFTNGLYEIPTNWLKNPVDSYNKAGYSWWAEVVNTNGGRSKAKYLYTGCNFDPVSFTSTNSWLVPPFYDGRVQLKQNLIFKLRAATRDFPFAYIHKITETLAPIITFSTTCVVADYFHAEKLVNQGEFLYRFNAFWPFKENTSLRNFVYGNSDAMPNANWPYFDLGHLATGVQGSYYNCDHWPYYPEPLLLSEPALYQFQLNAPGGGTIPALLPPASAQWQCSYPLDSPDMYYDYASGNMVSYGYMEEMGITPSFETDWDMYYNTFYTMAANASNYWGLPFLSAKIACANSENTGVETTTLSAGSQIEKADAYALPPWYFYPETAQPQFQTVEYNFWNPKQLWNDSIYAYSRGGLPGSTNFSTADRGDLLIAPVGDPDFMVAGYAKLAVLNGYCGAFGYLQQYLDKAYKMDADGNVTTNETGVLSPYGQFFASEPGPAALVTMPDVDTGARGTCTVHCVSLVLDKNHDGNMDLSFSGPDATSQASPMIAWVNNGYIKPGNNGSLDQELPLPANDPKNANCAAGKITCQRDLENFFRLWVCGVPQLPVGQGYTVTLSMSPVSGNPAINLYYSCETNGGTGYLTDTNIAATQTGSAYYANALCTISNSQSYTLQMNSYGNLLYTHFLFEGAGIGEGQLTMTISQNGNTIAQTGVWLDLRDVKSLYQRAKVTPRDPNGIPGPWTSATTTFDENTADVDITSDGYGFSSPADESKTATVFVHGSNLSIPSALSNGDTMFKRLYWQGYNGRFVLFYWNTLVGPWDGTIPAHYNYNEFRAFKYGLALKKYVENDLPAGYAKNVIGHSMGNMVIVSALYPRGSTPGMTCRNVIFMQAALPASCLDPSAAALAELANLESPQTTPDNFASQWGYRGLLATNVNATLYNIYNTNDFALGWWVTNQRLRKPGHTFYVPPSADTSYEWDGISQLGVLYYANGFLHRTVSDPQESISFIARSRTVALGAMATGGSINQNLNVGRGTDFPVPFLDSRDDHSGEFTRPIQQLKDFFNFVFVLVD